MSLAIDNFPEGNNEQRGAVQAFSARTYSARMSPLEALTMLVICFANYHFALLMALRVKRYYTERQLAKPV